MSGPYAAGPSPFEACSAARCAAERAPQGDGDGLVLVANLRPIQPDAPSPSRGAFRPSFASSLRPLKAKRAQGRPGAGWHPRSAARKAHAEKPHSSIQVSPNTRPSLRSGLTAYAVLSREPSSFWPPSPPRIDDAVHPVGLANASAKSLTVATTARTTRFCRTRIHLRHRVPSSVHTRRRMLARRTFQRRSSARGLGLTGTTRPARTSHADAAASTATPARET
ncbi:hypothetical protein ACVWXO_008551 [Bradyrhizobium sp. LM2.7]